MNNRQIQDRREALSFDLDSIGEELKGVADLQHESLKMQFLKHLLALHNRGMN
jgi:hypothetical protein